MQLHLLQAPGYNALYIVVKGVLRYVYADVEMPLSFALKLSARLERYWLNHGSMWYSVVA